MPSTSDSVTADLRPSGYRLALGVFCPLALTLGTWLLWKDRTPLGTFLSDWFWRPTLEPRPDIWLLFPILLVLWAAVYLLHKNTAPLWFSLSWLLILGFFLQHAFALTEGRGINGIRDRMLRTGHAGFLIETLKPLEAKDVALSYQGMLEDRRLAYYPNVTKPPGHLLFYIATERASRMMGDTRGGPALRTATFASLTWPLIAFLCLIPLYFVSRGFLTEQQAFVPVLIYLTLPNVLLMPLHLDQCLYPLLFCLPLAAVIHGLRSGRWGWLASGGALTSVALYFSFSLAVLGPYLISVICVAIFFRKDPPESKIRLLLKNVGLFVGGWALAQLAFFQLLRFNFLASYRRAIEAHQGWKIKVWSWADLMRIGVLDLVEYAIWTGWLVSFLAGAAMLTALRRLSAGRRSGWAGVLAVAAVPLVLGLAFGTKTVAESGRLWLCIAPLWALLAGCAWVRWTGKWLWPMTAALLTLQILHTGALKVWQDFF